MHLLDRRGMFCPWLLAVVFCAACDSSRDESTLGVIEPAAARGDSTPPGPAAASDPVPALEAPPSAAPARDDSGHTVPPSGESSSPVRINEIHYHPRATDPGSEFVEVVNTGSESVSLGGWQLTGGVRFTFPDETKLEAGAAAVIAQSAEHLRRSFGSGVPVAGEYTGRLDNAGELIRLLDSSGGVVSDVRYSDLAPWPEAADGQGPSLQRVSRERDVDDPENWGADSPTPGAPNRAERRVDLSLFDVRHSPARPVPGSAVTISAAAFHVAPVAELTLHVSDRGRERSIAMKRVAVRPVAEGRESVFAASLPPSPASSLIRYWITARSSANHVERSPPETSITSSHAYLVEDAEPPTSLPIYHLFIEPGDLSRLHRNPRSDQLYPATFAHAGRVHANVQVRLRGAWARSWPKKNWKFFFPRDARLGKRDRVNLNSCWRDASFIRESMAYRIYELCGALSLGTKMVRLHLNGEFWGLFVDVEQPKDRYLRRAGIPGAVLYKAASGGNQSDERFFRSAVEYARHYEHETHPEESFAALHDFCRSLDEARDVAEFFETRLDLPRYINYLCATTLTQNWDAFNKNHFIAHDRAGSGKWYAIPWDVDRTLGDHWSWGFSSTDLPLLLGTRNLPGPTGWNRLADRFFSVPSLKELYTDRLAELLETTFTEQALLPLVDRLAGSIRADAELDRGRWGGQEDWPVAVEQVRSFIKKRRSFVLSQLPGNAPGRPRNLSPPAGTRVAAFPLVLEASAFERAPRGGAHAATHWQVREAGSSYATPVLSIATRAEQGPLSIGKGLLRPRSRYLWRAAHVDARGRVSAYSEETSFDTGEFGYTAVPFDLTPVFNTDVVACPGDPTDDTVDGSRVLIVDGYDGRRPDNPAANGLPRDGVVGVHRLGDYRASNALQMSRASARDVDLPVERGRYSLIRLIVAGGNGDSRIPLRLVYDDGSSGQGLLACPDWYKGDSPDRPPQKLGPDTVTIRHGMDRIRRGSFTDNNRPALFEVILQADPARSLESIRLESRGAVYDSDQTTFNLFAVTGVRVD